MNSPGQLWTWGNNDSGQLGNGRTTNAYEPIRIQSATSQVVAVSGGRNFSMALLADGSLRAWGNNQYGQLGTGSTTDSTIPLTVPISNVRAIACGFEHSLALLSDNTLWAWGHNESGQLGINNTITYVATPTQISFDHPVTAVTTIAAGGRHTLAILSDGTVWAWGYNNLGQLGINSPTITRQYKPIEVTAISNIIVIAAGGYHSLAILSDNTVSAWGANYSGQCGKPYTEWQILVPTTVTKLSNIHAISCGNDHSLALSSGNTVWTWGDNQSGQLGIGSTAKLLETPTQITTLSSVTVAIAGGLKHSLALLSDGSLQAWGDNFYGELGNGLTTNSNIPVQIHKINNTNAMAQSYGEHNLAIANVLTRGIFLD